MLVLRKNNNWFPRVPSVFDDNFFRSMLNFDENQTQKATQPAVNIKENEKDFQIEIAAPGLKKEDFHIELNKNLLTISAKTETSKEENNENYYCKEFSYQNFSRSFNLGENLVVFDKILAKYENGILKLSLPKNEEAKVDNNRMIEIS